MVACGVVRMCWPVVSSPSPGPCPSPNPCAVVVPGWIIGVG